VCGIRSEAIQKRLLAVDNLILVQAQEFAMSMEAAAKDASELQVELAAKNRSYLPCINIKFMQFKMHYNIHKLSPTYIERKR